VFYSLKKKHLLFREALSYENRILNNDALNKVKAKRINICVQSIIITLIFSFVIIIVFMPLQLLLKLLIMIDIQKIISSLDLYHHF
jgi:hypothetical protein